MYQEEAERGSEANRQSKQKMDLRLETGGWGGRRGKYRVFGDGEQERRYYVEQILICLNSLTPVKVSIVQIFHWLPGGNIISYVQCGPFYEQYALCTLIE